MVARLHTGAAIEFCAATAKRPDEDWKLPTVVLTHGWKSDIFSSATYREIVRRLNVLGYNCLLLSLRGHEDAAGDISTVTRYDHAQDIRAAFQNLAERPEVDMSRCAAVGSSYGAYLLACIAPQIVSAKLLVLRAPALYPDAGWGESTQMAIAETNLRQWRRQPHMIAESCALKGVAEYKGKPLIVWSEQDEDLPVQVLESYARAMKMNDDEIHLIMSASHSLSGQHREEYLNVLEQFFSDNYPSR